MAFTTHINSSKTLIFAISYDVIVIITTITITITITSINTDHRP